MDGNSRHLIIKRVQADVPRGAPFDLATLASLGMSPQLAARCAEGGWLVRLAQSVHAFPNDDFAVQGALKFLHQRVGHSDFPGGAGARRLALHQGGARVGH